MESVEPVEFVPIPQRGRVYRDDRRVHLGDVGQHGRLRLEALARYLQDIATDDADDAGLTDDGGVWVLRRVELEVADRPRYHDRLELTTFCSGTGPRWAERRTQINGAGGVLVEAASLWVFIDGAGGRPLPLGDDFHERFGESAGGRRVSSRLRQPPPPSDPAVRPWTLRDSDFDVLDHLNNARALEAIEDELLARVPDTRPVRAAIEYREPVERTDQVRLASIVTHDGESSLAVWLLVGDAVRVSAVVDVTSGPDPT